MAQLSADAPITTKEEDELGYWSFVEPLARSLTRHSPSDGFVIGLEAKWGMGKTSAINLLLHAVTALETEKPKSEGTIIQFFNPWLFSGLEALVRGYLSQLGRALDGALEHGTPQATRRFVEKLVKGGGELERVQRSPIRGRIHVWADVCDSSAVSRRRRGWRGPTARICGIG